MLANGFLPESAAMVVGRASRCRAGAGAAGTRTRRDGRQDSSYDARIPCAPGYLLGDVCGGDGTRGLGARCLYMAKRLTATTLPPKERKPTSGRPRATTRARKPPSLCACGSRAEGGSRRLLAAARRGTERSRPPATASDQPDPVVWRPCQPSERGRAGAGRRERPLTHSSGCEPRDTRARRLRQLAASSRVRSGVGGTPAVYRGEGNPTQPTTVETRRARHGHGALGVGAWRRVRGRHGKRATGQKAAATVVPVGAEPWGGTSRDEFG
jgi:hypothetical protein